MASEPRYQEESCAFAALDWRYRWVALGILVLAAVWRVAFALNIPCAARDSVMFCTHARAMGETGLTYLRSPENQQHPLYPALLLAVQRELRACGAPDTPMTWLRSGQLISWLAGMTVVVLAGVLTRRVVRRVGAPVDERLAACFGMLLAAILPLNVWLSGEAMSDQLHLVFYLVGAIAILSIDRVGAALACGLAAGLAFLTRPEGMVLLPAGLVGIAAQRTLRWPVRVRRGLLLLGAFLVCAVPYWLEVGTLSPKKNPLNWLRGGEASVRDAGTLAAPSAPALAFGPIALVGPVVLGKLELRNVPWWGLIPYALYQCFRAGRVVVPLLAAFPLVALRDRLLRTPLVGVSAAAGGHFALTLLLLYRARYLDQRHMLVVNMLLLPFAAVALAHLWRAVDSPSALRNQVLAGMAVAMSLVVPASAAIRPSASGHYQPAAAAWLAQRDPELASKSIMSGSTYRPLVFYANARWIYWYEAPEEYPNLVAQILEKRPDYFAIETGEDFERKGSGEAIAKLRTDQAIAQYTADVYIYPNGGERLYFFRFTWPRSGQ